MEELKIIEVKQSIFDDNNADPNRPREELKKKKEFLLNLLSSPRSGKTTLRKTKNGSHGSRYRFCHRY